ncbi:MAG: Spy/CpxP family protein refolding chaperone [Acidobacteria bacterium]|nr:Spy/CpxP family protein refolding chaperone [Acidobacteriota bacterium]
MTITTRWVAVAVISALATGALSAGALLHAQAQPNPRGERSFGGLGGPRHGMNLLREIGIRHLDLTDAQEEQVRTVVQGHRDELTQIGARLRTANMALNDAVTASTFDESTIRARSAEVAAVQADAAVLKGRVHGEVWNILTPEQQQKAAELRAKVAARFQQRQR